MNSLAITALVLAVLAIAYRVGLGRSLGLARTGRLHSRPQYHGALVALWATIPLLLVLLVWGLASGWLDAWYVDSLIPADIAAGPDRVVAAQRVDALATGFGVAGDLADWETPAGQALAAFRQTVMLGAVALGAILAIGGLVLARARLSVRTRARNQVEAVIKLALILCSVIAIFTTLGIVVSLIFETLRFFSFVSPAEFFFGTVWNPRYSTTSNAATGGYGMLPLLVGTLMIATIAMLVAIPVGLMTAVWLTQYASPRLRNVVKPAVEVLAGIPTIVYGFFALVSVGPFLHGVGASVGLDVNATSALTAGIVMGIMIIPFISSLSDDIIRQVPRAMRDGSLGLGATKSETIRNVIVPAALPGIVGAILLAVSRAIGETMIVVLAAGNAPVLRFNPAEPSSSFTVTIVAALTGDSDFASPQSLVAFALGLTLFVLTLALNVGALAIVRKYREQYE
ncbi:MAG: phosphate ABC transporter permease subunit PstC [Rhodobacter sp.]|uniref:phosphate ABC transporter permease subunit PstC n=1 Tax=Pararhodobacter sp. TaxID=2127056 RepID=UPI001D9DADBA|nr:phosphate ABC transporter permease subunit PstC [Pararhodobacter sp.]MCB1346236.1 phosphate ABC transporter permease subunit PstC [Paracoccaceae bacterium]MCC0074598.1 phosphate ABC transporter permease subunit PstC [Rhodobacter sp.]HPD91692.1 phosphate ABC transporter permease subunit PstC [Pararhodobacter sp.]